MLVPPLRKSLLHYIVASILRYNYGRLFPLRRAAGVATGRGILRVILTGTSTHAALERGAHHVRCEEILAVDRYHTGPKGRAALRCTVSVPRSPLVC